MAMLAEKRKRVKYCLNPNGNVWNNDDNKIGQKMLEKMGWQKGQGLGANNQGITERLKVAYKFDSSGLGFKEKDMLSQHQNDYQSLLSELNNEMGTENNVQHSVASLEEKSRKSKSRVHYQKFTRGKDVSRYSSKDLISIFGKDQSNLTEVDHVLENKGNVINVGSMKSYFEKKLSEKKHKNKIQVLSDYKEDRKNIEGSQVNNGDETDFLHKSIIYRKNQNGKRVEQNVGVEIEDEDQFTEEQNEFGSKLNSKLSSRRKYSCESFQEKDSACQKKKSKKRKSDNYHSELNIDELQSNNDEFSDQVNVLNEVQVTLDSFCNVHEPNSDCIHNHLKKKKRKKITQMIFVNSSKNQDKVELKKEEKCQSKENNLCKGSKKLKKKSKKKQQVILEENNCNEKEDEISEEIEYDEEMKYSCMDKSKTIYENVTKIHTVETSSMREEVVENNESFYKAYKLNPENCSYKKKKRVTFNDIVYEKLI